MISYTEKVITKSRRRKVALIDKDNYILFLRSLLVEMGLSREEVRELSIAWNKQRKKNEPNHSLLP